MTYGWGRRQSLRDSRWGVGMSKDDVRPADQDVSVRSALRESEDRYRSLFEASLDAVLLTSPDGCTLAVNPAACRMFGCSEEELCRLGRAGVVDASDPRLPAALEERKRTGRFQGELTFIRKDGSRFAGELSSSVFKGRDGADYTCTVIRDIGPRKRAEAALREQEAFVRTVLDHLPIGIAVNSVDPSVKFEYMNDNFPRFYRTTREKLADPDGFWDAVYEDPSQREDIRRRVLADCASGDPARMHWADIPIRRRGGEITYVTAMNIPIPGRQLMLSAVMDVTEAKRAEAKMAAQVDELQRWHDVTADREVRVAELKQEVNRLLAQLGERAKYGGE